MTQKAKKYHDGFLGLVTGSQGAQVKFQTSISFIKKSIYTQISGYGWRGLFFCYPSCIVINSMLGLT